MSLSNGDRADKMSERSRAHYERLNSSGRAEEDPAVHALTTGLLAMIVAAGAIAASDKATVSFRDIDTDGDGRISVTEAGAHRLLIREFASVDVNQDDYVSEREFATWVSAQADINNPHETAASEEARPAREPWNVIERPQAAIAPLALRRW